MLRVLLLPFSLLYGGILWLRHFWYDSRSDASWEIPVKSLVIGNLCLGGSGKTPFSIWVGEKLAAHYRVGYLSRGYGRKSRGFQWVDLQQSPSQTGDEPRLVKEALPQVPVAVCEDRKTGIETMLQEHPELQLLVLDDAMQHRKVQPGMLGVLIPWSDLQGHRWLVPAGNQRDLWARRLKGDFIVITKCPTLPQSGVRKQVLESLAPFPAERVFWSGLRYRGIRSFDGKSTLEWDSLSGETVIFITAIANAQPILDAWPGKGPEVHLKYRDHHAFDAADLATVVEKQRMFAGRAKVVCTSKDRVKLAALLDLHAQQSWFEIEVEPYFDREAELEKLIIDYVEGTT
jgi:tetraacyldisaccharide 4'-kinase